MDSAVKNGLAYWLKAWEEKSQKNKTKMSELEACELTHVHGHEM